MKGKPHLTKEMTANACGKSLVQATKASSATVRYAQLQFPKLFFPARQGDVHHMHCDVPLEAAVRSLVNHHEGLLLASLADGDHQSAANCQLVAQCLWHGLSRTTHMDCIIGGVLRISLLTVTLWYNAPSSGFDIPTTRVYISPGPSAKQSGLTSTILSVPLASNSAAQGICWMLSSEPVTSSGMCSIPATCPPPLPPEIKRPKTTVK
jgi:hypothetical protein